MVDEHVALAQGREHVGGVLALGQPRVRGRHERLVLELGPVDAVQLPQRRQVQQPGHLHDVGGGDLELADQQVQDDVVHVLADLEAHRRPEAATGELALERLQQVGVAVLLDLEVGVAGDPERVRGEDLEAGEQRVQVGADELLERQPAGAVGTLDRHEARHVVRDLDPGEVLRAGRRVADEHGEVQRQAADVGERVAGVDGERREHREDLAAEVVVQRGALAGVEVAPAHHPHAGGGQGGPDVVAEAAGVPAGELAGALGDERELLAGPEAVGAADAEAGALPPLQPGHPDHVELVEVAGEDGQELRPLQQRQASRPRPAPARAG